MGLGYYLDALHYSLSPYLLISHHMVLGYYADDGAQVYVLPRMMRFAEQSYYKGMIPGCCYKMGRQGLGYYSDIGRLDYVQPLEFKWNDASIVAVDQPRFDDDKTIEGEDGEGLTLTLTLIG